LAKIGPPPRRACRPSWSLEPVRSQSSLCGVESLPSDPETRTTGEGSTASTGAEGDGGTLRVVVVVVAGGGAVVAVLGVREGCVGLVGLLVAGTCRDEEGVTWAGVLATGGNSRRPAVSGSEARPMRWRTSWLVPQVIAAASPIPSTARTATSRVRREALMGLPPGIRAPRPRRRPGDSPDSPHRARPSQGS
jgi:hypothetical protein